MSEDYRLTRVFAILIAFLVSALLPLNAEASTLFPSYIDIATDALGAHSVASADLDNDGDLDLISASRQDGRLRWYRNDGNEASFTAMDIDIIDGIYVALPGDIDGDGDVDIAAAAVSEVRPSALPSVEAGFETSAGTVLWYENDGSARFERHVVFNELKYPVAISLADLNRDGALDLLSASRDDNSVLWYENDGDRYAPSFTPYTLTDTALGAVSVDTADFDGDGDIDVVSASEDDDQIAWYENIGPQPLQFLTHVIQRATEPVPPDFDYAKSVHGADVDGDGDMDIVYGSENDNLLGWYENQGGQPLVFVQHTVATESDHAKFVTAADVDLDGDTDLFVASTGDHTVAWYENDGAVAPGFTRRVVTTAALGARYVHVIDLDGDGDADVLTASRDDSRVTWHQNRTIHRSAYFPASGAEVVDSGMAAVDLDTHDLNSDGRFDIVAIGPGELRWFENMGEASAMFAGHLVDGDVTDGQQVDIADLNHDGRNDLLFVANGGATLGWYEQRSGASFQSHILNTDAGDIRTARVADIDGDGDLDVATASVGSDGVTWYENRGGSMPSYTAHVVSNDAATAQAVTDLDGDGQLDLIMAMQQSDGTGGPVMWYQNLGGRPPAFSAQVIIPALSSVSSLLSVDLDVDGDVDLLSLSGEPGTLTLHENLGGQPPGYLPSLIDSGLLAGAQLKTADLDQDGDQDIVAGSDGDNGVWYENNDAAVPTFTRRTLDEMANRPVAATDVDGDGDLDLAAIANDGNTIQWIDNRGGQVSAIAAESLPSWTSLSQPIELASLTLTHRGRQGDGVIALSELTVHFIDSDGYPLAAGQVQRRYRHFSLYRDSCCDGVFDPVGDMLIAQVDAENVSSGGTVTFDLSAGEGGAQIATHADGTFFLVVHLSDICDIGTQRHHVTFTIGDGGVVDGQTGQELSLEGGESNIPATPARTVDVQIRPRRLPYAILLPVAYGVPGCER